MEPKKNRRWLIAGLAAAAVVFLIMATGEVTTGATATRSAEAVLASGAAAAIDPGPAAGGDNSSNSSSPSSTAEPEPDAADSTGAGAADRGAADRELPAEEPAEEDVTGSGATDPPVGGDVDVVERNAVVEFLRQLLDALGITPQELAEEAADAEADSAGGAGTGSGQDNGEPAAGAAEPAAGAITIANFAFGQPVTVAPGATVEVRNTDAAPHNVTADDESFSTENIAQDETATFTAPTRPGRYTFSCTLHPEMTGTLIVEGAGDEGTGAATERPGGSVPAESRGDTATRTPATSNDDAEPSQAPSTGSGYGSGNGY